MFSDITDAHLLCCAIQEFADNLQGKGIHGAVMALDPSFDTDVMAKTLGIPSNKHMLHRHLYEEMKSLSSPHRSAVISNAKKFMHTTNQNIL